MDMPPTGPPAKTVLILDDVLINLKVLERILRPAGYHVICVMNALDALAAAQREHPDLILLDTRFSPDDEADEPWNSDGICLMEFFHQMDRFKHIPIIIVTADVIPEVRDRALKAGALAFVELPIHTKPILNLVRISLAPAVSAYNTQTA